MFAEVIVDIAHSEVDKIFDYDCQNLNVKVGSRVIVPFGNIKIEGVVVKLKDTTTFDISKVKHIIRLLEDEPALTKESILLMEFMCERYHIPKALALRQFLPTEMRKGKVREKLIEFATINDKIILSDYTANLKARDTNKLKVVEYLQQNIKEKLSTLRKTFPVSAVNKLIEDNVLTVFEEREIRSPYKKIDLINKNVTLTERQNFAVNSILNNDKKITLLHGVTGSGKTEVYLHVIKKCIESGKTAILLVPEISLTPQMLSQLRSTFKNDVAILHSGLSQGERFDEWWRLRSKEAKIAVGARSAIFAPLENLGVIIIDEEHDQSYFSESSPRYSTFDIANFRANFNDCRLVLGSATPSIESYNLAKNGVYNLIEMPERINKKPMPEMIIADMRAEVRRGNVSAFSTPLKDELTKCIESGNQAIIFLNRRGYSQHIVCRDCGYVAKCDNCDIALNYHSEGNLLKCHYCGMSYKMLTACPDCGSLHINYVGTGTQRVVEDLKKLLPNAKILRMDNDTTNTKDGHFNILKQFSEHKADILVGTQMIAKGHDFPSVTLVGILDADMSLFFSDYRSGERTFQLITQVAGRSGRADSKGVVVLQTYQPDNAILRYAINYDYKGFFDREVALRKSTFYPPFAMIVRVMVESPVDMDGIETLKNVYEDLKALYENERDGFIFFNKMKCPIKRLKNKFRYQVLMRIKENRQDILQKVYDVIKYTNNKALVYVEVNPSNLS